MGTECTAFTVSALYNLINNRLMAKRPMIINTNLLPETLSEKYSPAVAPACSASSCHCGSSVMTSGC